MPLVNVCILTAQFISWTAEHNFLYAVLLGGGLMQPLAVMPRRSQARRNMEITLHFTNRNRFCRGLNHLRDHPEKYAITCYGRILGSTDSWYIEYVKLSEED